MNARLQPSKVEPVVTRTQVSDIHALQAICSSTVAAANTQNYTPFAEKILRSWNLTEAAAAIGVSAKTVLRHIKKMDLPTGVDSAGRRLFSLDEINTIRDALGLSPSRHPDDPAMVLSFCNFKGGVAKTSSSIHCAQYFAFHGYRTLVIDADPQGSLTTLLGKRPDYDIENWMTIADYLTGPHQSPDTWTGTLKTAIQPTYWPRLDLIAANLSLSEIDFTLAQRLRNAQNPEDPENAEKPFLFYHCLADGIRTIQDEYDVIIIDTPPSLSYLTLNAVFASSGLIVPVTPGRLEFDSSTSFFALLAETLDVVNKIEATPKVFDFLSILITRFNSQSRAHANIHSWLRGAAPERVLLNSMIQTTVLAADDNLTAYERTSWGQNKRRDLDVLERATDALNRVNGEIEQAVRSFWPRTRPLKRVAAPKTSEVTA